MSSRLFIRALIFNLALCVTISAKAAQSSVPQVLPVDQARSTTARQLAKPILDSRVLDEMESTDNWRVYGPGEMAITTERHREGAHSLRLISPTKGKEPPKVQGRPFGETGLRREFSGQDWTAFNRISVWVYPDLPGFKVVSLLVRIHSEGTEGRSYTDGGLHHVLVKNHEWNQVAWEIEHLDRSRVRSLDLIYRLQGNEPSATERVAFDFDHLELQRVAPDPFRGWNPAGIAFSHTGYGTRSEKIAIAPSGTTAEFELVDTLTGRSVWKKQVSTARNQTDDYALLDFSSLDRQGMFQLRFGALKSAPFRIGKSPLREPLNAGLNFFFGERCGFAVPGIHDVCHQDWRVEHNGGHLFINGGWHDAGDLSQGLINTSEAVWSMLRLADSMAKRDPELAQRFREEARWGAEWLLKTRFGDGFRATWATMDFWTDGVLGNVDDVTAKAGNSPFENLTAAAAEAAAARAYRKTHPDFACRLLAAAQDDYQYAVGALKDPGLELASAATQAALELYRTTSIQRFGADARAFARSLTASQQTEFPGWDKPMRGFFYTSPKRDRLLHYNHRSHEQAPVVALADLCREFPRDPQAPSWREAVKLYGDYLTASARFTEPYHMFCAGIYRLADTGDTDQRKQIEQGVRLADGIYLRRFPVWGDFRGNLGVLLSQATAAAAAGRLFNSEALGNLARQQLEWTLGRNPFCQSLMYGVGQDYAPQYTSMSGDITGSLPVGIQSRLHEDVPYWPPANCYNYAEVWVHPVSRFFSTAAELQR